MKVTIPKKVLVEEGFPNAAPNGRLRRLADLVSRKLDEMGEDEPSPDLVCSLYKAAAQQMGIKLEITE